MADNDEKEFDTRAAADRRYRMIEKYQTIRDTFKRIENTLTTQINKYYSMTPTSEREEQFMMSSLNVVMEKVWEEFEYARTKMKSM
jgi:hypothetical protein